MDSEQGGSIRAEGVSVVFGTKKAVDSVSIEVADGSIFVLLGASGCGKSTLMKALIGLLVPDEGRVLIGGQEIVRLTEEEMRPIRRKMGVAFQGGAMFSSLTLLENLVMPIVENGESGVEEAEWIARMKLDMVGLLDARDKLPSELSGGMRKRGAIARALALDPRILFLDEPTSGLDPITAAEIDDLVVSLNRTFGVTVFAVTHDIASAERISDEAALMDRGRVIAQQPMEELRRNDDPRVVALLERRPTEVERSETVARYFATPAEGGEGGRR